MSDTNHSPAPWETSRDAVPDGYVQVTVYDANGNRVATVFQNEGNVALVKSAPRLLAACKLWQRAEEDGGISMADFRTIASNAIREAIAEAEGD